MEKRRKLSVLIREDVHQKLKIKCVQENVSIQEWLSALVERELKNIELLHNVVGLCPLCGSNVVEGLKGYSCSGWHKGCKFIVWKEIARRFIAPAEAARLLALKEAGPFNGFKSKKGKEFSATLRLEDGKVIFVYGDNPRQATKENNEVYHVAIH